MKKSLKRLVALCLSLVFVFSIFGCSKPSTQTPANNDTNTPSTTAPAQPSAEVVKLRLATSVKPDNPMNLAAQHFADQVKEMSDGRIEITVFPSGQLGTDAEVIEQMMQGSIDMVEVSGIVYSNYSDLANAWQLPFLYKDWDHFSKSVKSDASLALLDGLGAIGIKGLAVYTSPFRHLCTTDKPVEKLEDMKGLKIRVAQAPLMIDIFSAIGANPTPMAFGEVYSGLQNKVIDATETDFFGIVGDKFGEVCKFVTYTAHYNWPALLSINKEKFDSFSPEDQKILMQAAAEGVDYNIELVKAVEVEYKQKMIDMGVTLSTLPESELNKFKEAVSPVIKKYTALDPKIQAYVDYVDSIS